MRWAASEGIVNGVSDTAFAPDDPVTREQFAAILWRYAQYKGYDVSEGENTNKICEQLYDLALLAHGSLSPERMTGFVARTNEIMMMLAEK